MEFFEPGTKFKLNELITWRDVDDELIILELESGNYYSLNDIGRFIWLQLSADKSFAEIVSEITEEYEAGEDQARHDSYHFLKGLIEHKIILSV